MFTPNITLALVFAQFLLCTDLKLHYNYSAQVYTKLTLASIPGRFVSNLTLVRLLGLVLIVSGRDQKL